MDDNTSPAIDTYTEEPEPYVEPIEAQPPAQDRWRDAAIAAIVVMLVGILGMIGWLLLTGNTASNKAGAPANGGRQPGVGASASTGEGIQVGALAPDFTLNDASTGKPVKLSSLRGHPVWINFWATWCPPCQAEMPDMQGVYNEYKDKGLTLLGVDAQESAQAVNAYTAKGKFTWTFLLDSDGKTVDKYLVNGLPTHYFVDKDGIIRAIHVGGLQNTLGTIKVDLHDYLNKIVTP